MIMVIWQGLLLFNVYGGWNRCFDLHHENVSFFNDKQFSTWLPTQYKRVGWSDLCTWEHWGHVLWFTDVSVPACIMVIAGGRMQGLEGRLTHMEVDTLLMSLYCGAGSLTTNVTSVSCLSLALCPLRPYNSQSQARQGHTLWGSRHCARAPMALLVESDSHRGKVDKQIPCPLQAST